MTRIEQIKQEALRDIKAAEPDVNPAIIDLMVIAYLAARIELLEQDLARYTQPVNTDYLPPFLRKQAG